MESISIQHVLRLLSNRKLSPDMWRFNTIGFILHQYQKHESMRFEHDRYLRLSRVVLRQGWSGFSRVWKVNQIKDSSQVKQRVRCCDWRALTFKMASLEVTMIFALEALRFSQKQLPIFIQIVPVAMHSLSMASRRKHDLCFETIQILEKKKEKKITFFRSVFQIYLSLMRRLALLWPPWVLLIPM